VQDLIDKTTGDIRIDALLHSSFLPTGLQTGTPVTISYAFAERAFTIDEVNYNLENYPNFLPMDASLQAQVRETLDYITAHIGVQFTETADPADAMMRFGTYNGGAYDDAAGFAQSFTAHNDGMHRGTDVYINYGSSYFEEPIYTDGISSTILHEIGHALGLKHPGHYDETDQGPYLPEEWDNATNTVMSYNDDIGPVFGEFDLLALRHLYSDTFTSDAQQIFAIPADKSSVRGSIIDDIFIYDVAVTQGTSAHVSGDWGDDWLDIRISDPSPFYLTFDSGPGIDHAKFNVSFDALEHFVVNGADQARVDMLSSANGWQTIDLQYTERLHFTDHSLALDIEGNAGDMFRLYQAALDREGDLSGLGYWIDLHDNGTTLTDIATGFLESAEFNARLGDTANNSAFVDALYQNVLGRQGEPSGVNFWMDALESNTTQRNNVLVNFSESAENRANVADTISDGIAYTPFEMVEIA